MEELYVVGQDGVVGGTWKVRVGSVVEEIIGGCQNV